MRHHFIFEPSRTGSPGKVQCIRCEKSLRLKETNEAEMARLFRGVYAECEWKK